MHLRAAGVVATIAVFMLTKEDLQSLGELIVASEERIRKDTVTKSDLEANNRVVGTIIKVELAETNQRIDAIVTAMKAGFLETTKQVKRVEQKLDTIAEDHEERITRLEATADLTHKN